MDALINQTHDLVQKLLSEGKLKEAGLASEAFNLFPKNDVDRVINPVHPDIKKACLVRIKRKGTLNIRLIYNLAKIAKFSKDEVRLYIETWILDEMPYNLSKEELEMVLELV